MSSFNVGALVLGAPTSPRALVRHTYLTLGGPSGIDLRTLQGLAGHSTPTRTARYSHRRLSDLAGAVDKLPDLVPTSTRLKSPFA